MGISLGRASNPPSRVPASRRRTLATPTPPICPSNRNPATLTPRYSPHRPHRPEPPMKPWIYTAAPLAALSFTVGFLYAGCGPVQCDEEGCLSGPTVEFADTGWQEGTWRVELAEDNGAIGACELELPSPGDLTRPCVGNLRLSLDRNGEHIESIRVNHRPDGADPTPSPLTVRVHRDDEQVAKEIFVVDYETVRPNGEGCPPTCHQATVEMSLAD